MKKLIYILLILLGFTSCMKEESVKLEEQETLDKVDIVFGVSLPEPPIKTKAMDSIPHIQKLKVAVFGGSGYLKEYVEATPIQKATKNDVDYTYKVQLSLSDSHLKVHFIANGPETLPFKYEDEVMASLTTSDTTDAYWQRIELPNGITVKKYTADDTTQVPPVYMGDPIKENGKYVVSDETRQAFARIPLIRNFAKIVVVDNTSDFELLKYDVFYKPSAGSVAAYNRDSNKFVMGYETLSFEEVKSKYPGNLPASATIDKTIPSHEAFQATRTDDPVYMYERPIPTSDASFVIVYGKYKDGFNYYYKIDLQDSKGYYAIYRNFQYTIRIDGIAKPGSSTPTEAYNSAGSGDISTDQKAENLTDVSDGVARIYVQYTEHTIIGNSQTVELLFKFLPDANNADSVRNDLVSYEVGAASSAGEVISGGNVTIATSDTDDHWRKLSFTSTNAEDFTKTQTIKVIGTYGENNSKLFRTITYKLMGIQPMVVICDPHDLLQEKGEKVKVIIKIPEDLPRSIFPLHLNIESSKLSISPDNDNLPVETGRQIYVNNNPKASYHFVETLSYDEYDKLLTKENGWVVDTTFFKTTKEISDCRIYVANEYFIGPNNSIANDSISTYIPRYFTAAEFDTYVQSAGGDVTFYFGWDNRDRPETITVKLTYLKPAEGSNQLEPQGNGVYTYKTSSSPSSSSSAQLSLVATGDRYYGVELSARHYSDTSHFNNYLIVGSQIIDIARNSGNQIFPNTTNQTRTVYLCNTSGDTVGEFTVSRTGRNNNNYIYRNSADFNVDVHMFTNDDIVYFHWPVGNNNYYSTRSYTLSDLENASSSQRLSVSFSTTQPTAFPYQ